MAHSKELNCYVNDRIMRFRTKIKAFVVITVLIISACSIIKEEVAPIIDTGKINRYVEESTLTKGSIFVDSIQLSINYQTNKRMMLIHQIKNNNGLYYLDFSEKDIMELAIPDSLFCWALDFVNSLNAE